MDVPPLSENTLEEIGFKREWFEKKLDAGVDEEVKKKVEAQIKQLLEKEEKQRQREERQKQRQHEFTIGRAKRRRSASASTDLFCPNPKRVSQFGRPASAAKPADVDSNCLEWPVHRHWLAASLKDAFNHYNENGVKYTINNVEIEYDSALISRFVDNYRRIVKPRIDDSRIPELWLTPLLAEIFKELFSLNLLEDKVSCAHQYPIGDKKERSDLMVSVMSEDYKTTRVILIADMKPNEKSDSKVGSMAYASRAANLSDSFGVQLVLVYTCYGCMLYLVQSANEKLIMFQICDVFVHNDQMYQFAFALLLGVKYLVTDTTVHKQSLYNPLPDIYVPKGDIFGSRHRAFKHGDQFYKCFVPSDAVQTGEKPNIEVIKSLGEKLGFGNYFEELSITSCFGLEYMKYKYIEVQDSCSPSRGQIAQVANILDVLHGLGFVHSDIRVENIIFAQDGRPYIIDFDMVDHEDINYPPQYNSTSIFERHPTARKNAPRKKEHDIYALKMLIELWTGDVVETNSLKEIAENFGSTE